MCRRLEAGPVQAIVTPAHERKCWDCGNVADHADDITPHVNCKKCGSQDTRRTKRRVEKTPKPVTSDEPECPHCHLVHDAPEGSDQFTAINCDCGYRFEAERTTVFVSRMYEQRG